MTRNFLMLLMFVGLIGYSSVLTAQEKYTINPRFEPGKYVQTQVTTGDTLTRVEGLDADDMDAKDGFPMKQEQMMKFFLDVSQPDAQGTQTVKLTIAEIKVTQTAMGMEKVFDSTNIDKQDPMLAPVFNAMVGSEITFDLTKDGKSENIRGFDEIWDKLFKNLPGAPTEMFESFKESMGDEMLSHTLGGIGNTLGEKPRAVGDQWTEVKSMTLPFLGKSDFELNHTLKSVKDDVAVIVINGKITMQGNTMEMGPAKLNIEKGDMNMASTTSINIKTGLVFETKSEIEMDMTMKMDMTMPVEEDAPQEMKMHITTKAVSTMTVEKVQ